MDWGQLVWFPLTIPKQVFVLWLVMKNCLTAGDRLAKWGYKGEVTCVYCQNVWKAENTSSLNAAIVREYGRKS